MNLAQIQSKRAALAERAAKLKEDRAALELEYQEWIAEQREAQAHDILTNMPDDLRSAVVEAAAAGGTAGAGRPGGGN